MKIEPNECIATARPTEQKTQFDEQKAEVILRLHSQGFDLKDIVDKTAPCGIPDPEADEFAFDGSPTAEYRKRRVYERYTAHVAELIASQMN